LKSDQPAQAEVQTARGLQARLLAKQVLPSAGMNLGNCEPLVLLPQTRKKRAICVTAPCVRLNTRLVNANAAFSRGLPEMWKLQEAARRAAAISCLSM